MSLFNLFRKNKASSQNIDELNVHENEIYFHEDMYCQVELVPRENIFHLEKENEKINEFSKEHLDGTGYTDIYVRENSPISIAERKITIDNLHNFLTPIGFTKSETVYYGYGSEKIKSDNTNAYRLNRAHIFFDYKEDIVTAFWINGFRFHKSEEFKKKLMVILYAIGNEYNVVLNDWDLSVTVDLSSKIEIEKYLNEGF
ncbi:MAG: hypothetical protein DI539_04775 [Flavobacterium psychrophilum]|nr:MAG: hypothetical protein DI539_04775 [Flavobacterium psychrophilum]